MRRSRDRSFGTSLRRRGLFLAAVGALPLGTACVMQESLVAPVARVPLVQAALVAGDSVQRVTVSMVNSGGGLIRYPGQLVQDGVEDAVVRWVSPEGDTTRAVHRYSGDSLHAAGQYVVATPIDAVIESGYSPRGYAALPALRVAARADGTYGAYTLLVDVPGYPRIAAQVTPPGRPRGMVRPRVLYDSLKATGDTLRVETVVRPGDQPAIIFVFRAWAEPGGFLSVLFASSDTLTMPGDQVDRVRGHNLALFPTDTTTMVTVAIPDASLTYRYHANDDPVASLQSMNTATGGLGLVGAITISERHYVWHPGRCASGAPRVKPAPSVAPQC